MAQPGKKLPGYLALPVEMKEEGLFISSQQSTDLPRIEVAVYRNDGYCKSHFTDKASGQYFPARLSLTLSLWEADAVENIGTTLAGYQKDQPRYGTGKNLSGQLRSGAKPLPRKGRTKNT